MDDLVMFFIDSRKILYVGEMLILDPYHWWKKMVNLHMKKSTSGASKKCECKIISTSMLEE